MFWLDVKNFPPPPNKRILVLKTYLDAPYTELGYDPEKSFWTYPEVQVDSAILTLDGKYVWTKGGRVTHWHVIHAVPDDWNK